MKRKRIVASFAVVGMVMASLLLFQGGAWAQGNSPLMVSNGEHKAHIVPTVSQVSRLGIPGSDPGPLLYNGGPVMSVGAFSSLTSYAIYWVPAHLQNGGATSMSAHYQSVQTNLLHDYEGHSLGTNNTQYYQTIGGTNYIGNREGPYYTYVDTNPYPASGCTDPATPGNCITDAQIQTEIQRVMTLKGWTGGINKLFLMYTSSGEGSCFDSGGSSCAYEQYCAYHSFFGSAPVVYGNEPYGDPTVCSTGGPFPTGDAEADTAVSTATHEMSEAITDPELNAWYTALGNEIGDLCAYNYGTNTWDSGNANENWYGHFYEVQMEYDNHVGGCVQVGP